MPVQAHTDKPSMHSPSATTARGSGANISSADYRIVRADMDGVPVLQYTDGTVKRASYIRCAACGATTGTSVRAMRAVELCHRGWAGKHIWDVRARPPTRSHDSHTFQLQSTYNGPNDRRAQ